MPLNLNEFKPLEDEIVLGEMTVKVCSDVPRGAYKEFEGLENDKDPEVIMSKTERWIEKILAVSNDQKTVKGFMEKIKNSTAMLNQVATFISEIVQKGAEKKKS